MLRRPKIRGNILAIAMALMCVLVTIVIAMHTSQTRAVRSVTQAEAELQFRQSAEFAAAEFFSVAQPAPSSLRVSAGTAEETTTGSTQSLNSRGDLRAHCLPQTLILTGAGNAFGRSGARAQGFGQLRRSRGRAAHLTDCVSKGFRIGSIASGICLDQRRTELFDGCHVTCTFRGVRRCYLR